MLKIEKTEDYTLFKKINGNRALNKSHISRLIQSISQNAESIKYTPIVVNEDYEIIDGQHRLEAIKKLNLPVYYIMHEGLGLMNVQGLNSMSKSWTPMDFARSYAEIGNKHYKTYIEFKQKYKLNHDILLAYLGLDDATTGVMFKSGKLKVRDPRSSHDLCLALIDLGAFYDGFKRRSFAIAFKRMWSNKYYDHKYFISKLKVHGYKIEDYALPEDYLRSLEKIYNSHLRDEKERVRFF